jgi:hypothetical protein
VLITFGECFTGTQFADNVNEANMMQNRQIHRQLDSRHDRVGGNMAGWFTHRTSDLMGSSRRASRCFLEQHTLHSLLSTDWFEEWIRKFIFTSIASYTIDLK